MFIRKVKTRNSICFQIGEKEDGRFKLVKHIGCSTQAGEIEALRFKANQILKEIVFKNQLSLFSDPHIPSKAKLLSWRITGYHQTIGKVYDNIGFPASILKDLVIARIVYPKSKAATVRYVSSYLGITLNPDRVYRFMDRLDKDRLTRIAFTFVSHKNKGISLFFYDVTTLHFESETENALRQKGFSKNHRGDMPQVLIGLFVDHEGYPFDFSIFEGNTFEGHTFQKAISDLTIKYAFTTLTVVADAGMLSAENLHFLDIHHFNYVVGARLKNMNDEMIKKMTTHDYLKESIWEIYLNQQRLIIEHSPSRARKDVSDREKIIKKLHTRLNNGKEMVRKSKYLLCESGGKATGIDQTKVSNDTLFDGLKGFITNEAPRAYARGILKFFGERNPPKHYPSTLLRQAQDSLRVSAISHSSTSLHSWFSAKADKSNTAQAVEVVSQYRNLWQVEKAFRISKNDLKERPIFHQNIKRIKSHLLLCFIALVVVKETEKILSFKGYSLYRVIEVLGKVGEGEVRVGNINLPMDSELSEEAQLILKLFEGY